MVIRVIETTDCAQAVAGNNNAWDIKKALKADASAADRAGVSSNPLIDVATLRALSEDSSAQVLDAVAGNPSTLGVG